jgi:xanthosine utilization system XapX-like protein
MANEPGRIRQILEVLALVIKRDRLALLWLGLGALGPIAAGIVYAILVTTEPVGFVIAIVLGILVGVLGFLIVLGQLTQRLMYTNLQGQPGAVSALLKNQLRRSWRGNDVPIRMNKSQDIVYRVVGRPGVVLISEGVRSRIAPLVDDARKEVNRIVPGVPVHVLHVGDDGLALKEFFPQLYKIKGRVKSAEIVVVSNRLNSIAKTPASMIPKGIDPTKMRAPRPR